MNVDIKYLCPSLVPGGFSGFLVSQDLPSPVRGGAPLGWPCSIRRALFPSRVHDYV